VTRTFAEFVAGAEVESLPDWTIHEAKRTLLNLLAISLSASRSDDADILIDWARREGSRERASVVGSDLRTSPSAAALLNGYLCHLQDYDDTHFPTVLHPTAPVWPAVLATAEEHELSGLETLAAFVLGAETACRVAISVHPWHYDAGWHITGTAGVFGAAAGAGRVLGLEPTELVAALGAAGTRASGVREVFGSHGKPLHAGQAASSGTQAATWAKAGFTASDDIIGGRRGFWAVLSAAGHSEDALLGELGRRWELRMNGLKPYANGVVSHPLQDAVIELRNAHDLTVDKVAAIEARVHPLVPELMGRAEPRVGLEGKFSFRHCAAAALVDGAGHDAQFTDEKVKDPVISALRTRVSATVDPTVREDEVYVAIVLKDGTRHEIHIEHATGSPENPMSDVVLRAKYDALAREVFTTERADALWHAVWTLDEAPNVSEVASLMQSPRR
jgi:2-methylcitrate dehydratase PrpD